MPKSYYAASTAVLAGDMPLARRRHMNNLGMVRQRVALTTATPPTKPCPSLNRIENGFLSTKGGRYFLTPVSWLCHI
jgi:hypothetical protein